MALPGLASEAAEERDQVVKAVFLDRDGVINANLERRGKPVAPTTLEEFRILPGVEDAARRLVILLGSHGVGFSEEVSVRL